MDVVRRYGLTAALQTRPAAISNPASASILLLTATLTRLPLCDSLQRGRALAQKANRLSVVGQVQRVGLGSSQLASSGNQTRAQPRNIPGNRHAQPLTAQQNTPKERPCSLPGAKTHDQPNSPHPPPVFFGHRNVEYNGSAWININETTYTYFLYCHSVHLDWLHLESFQGEV